jgi:hypothetical protein
MTAFPKGLRFWTALALAMLLGLYDVAPASAALAPSRATGSTAIASVRDADMVMAQRALENRIVAQKLRDYGVEAADVQTRLATMSDQDLHTLASASKGLPSGSDGATGAIIGILVIVILVIVILKLTNHDVVVR